MRATVRPVSGGGGWAALVILHDVSDVRRAETARRDFVANVSHELRTPLAGIKAVVETLRDGAIHCPEGPGLGFRPEPERLAALASADPIIIR